MPSNRKVREILIKKISCDKRGKIVELGAGWGHLALPIAKKFPKREVVALEFSPLPYITLLFLQKVLRLKNLHVIHCDFFNYNLNEADCVICYLYPKAMEKLQIKFIKELKPGAHILSNTFALPKSQPLEICRANDLFKSKVYVYEV